LKGINFLEHIFETLWSLLVRTIRFLLIDILIDLVLQGLGYAGIKLLKLITGGRYPAGPVAEQSESLKVGCGVVMLLLLFMVWLWLWSAGILH
jgi:hypothetical protein